MAIVIRLTLVPEYALPLVTLLREFAAALYREAQQAGQGEQRHADFKDIETLVGLFAADLVVMPVASIDEFEIEGVARACALLRLELRRRHFGHLSDADLESALNRTDFPAGLECVRQAYGFLLVIQQHAIEPYVMPLAYRTHWLGRLTARLQRLYRDDRPLLSFRRPAPAPWQVVVHDDPVNSMLYITLAFERVLGLSNARAEAAMCEVHETKRAVVWSGSQADAEARARRLRAWHLLATSEPTGA